MINSNKSKIKTIKEHPIAPIYFKYIDILISRDLNQEAQYLLDLASIPLTEENIEVFTNIVVQLMRIAREEDNNHFNEFEELRLELENPN